MSEDIANVFIKGKKIDLLPLNPDHVNLYCKWENNPTVRRYARTEIPLTLEDSKKFLNSDENKVKSRVVFEILYKKDKIPIGYCELTEISWTNRNAYIGLLIGEIDYWGHGIGTESIKLILNYGFNELNLSKIKIEALEPNLSSIYCIEKNGFKLEGSLREEVYVDGLYYDLLVYGILKEEWIEKNSGT
jgi:RimJ/RimL family protein N-acetyltransferase